MSQSTFALYTALLTQTIMNFFSTTFPNQLKPSLYSLNALKSLSLVISTSTTPTGSPIPPSPVLFILFINDLLTSTSSSIHSFADDTFLSSSFSFNPNDHASTDIQLHRNISASLLSNDLTVIEKWG